MCIVILRGGNYIFFRCIISLTKVTIDDNIEFFFLFVLGIKPGNQIYKNWDVRKMETDSAKGKKSERQVSETTQKIMQAAALNKEGI